MTPTKIIKDAINKGMRQLKHSKGFGVHSPFAYDIIREVIEERCAYYAYYTMQRTYAKDSPMTMKVAALLLRLANRFRTRTILEVCCDGGYTALPLVLTDSRNRITSITWKNGEGEKRLLASTRKVLQCSKRASQVSFLESLDALPEDYRADMIVISDLPKAFDAEQFESWLKLHSHESSIIWLKGIRPKGKFHELWAKFFNDENIEITMDLYDYGLVIRRPRFFKQHYVVSF